MNKWIAEFENVRSAITAIKNGQPLPEDCEILTKEAYSDLCLRACKEQEDDNT